MLNDANRRINDALLLLESCMGEFNTEFERRSAAVQLWQVIKVLYDYDICWDDVAKLIDEHETGYWRKKDEYALSSESSRYLIKIQGIFYVGKSPGTKLTRQEVKQALGDKFKTFEMYDVETEAVD